MIDAPPLQLTIGPASHGVVQYALDVAASVTRLDDRVRVHSVPDALAGVAALAGIERAHVHVTDRLLGRSPEEAAAAVERLGAATTLTLTLHDVPQTSDGAPLSRRISAYERCIAASAGIVVNSAHERSLIAEFLRVEARPVVIPLGSRVATVGDGPTHAGLSAASPDLVVLISGFLYPGKGHLEAILAAAEAAASLRAGGAPVGRVVVRAIGAASPGHEGDVAVLADRARRIGVDLEVTGYLDDASFAEQLIVPGIPLAAHQHVSASRSMLDWVEAGRRPLVIDSRYAAEMDELRPETIGRFEPSSLAQRLVDAWADPASTWLPAGRSLRPTLDDSARSYLDWWASR